MRIIGLAIVSGLIGLASCSASSQKTTCDSPQVIALVQQILSGQSNSGDLLEVHVTNQQSDETRVHLTCQASVRISPQRMSDLPNKTRDGLGLLFPTVESFTSLTYHVTVGSGPGKNFAELVKTESVAKLMQAISFLQMIGTPSVGDSQAHTAMPSPPTTFDATSYVGKNICEVINDLDQLDSLSNQFKAMFGRGRWFLWRANYTAECGPIEMITDPDLGTLIVIPKRLPASTANSAVLFLKPNGTIQAGCFAEDGQNTEWIGSGWSSKSPEVQCSRTVSTQDKIQDLKLAMQSPATGK